MTLDFDEPTPCLLDKRWITLDTLGNQQAAAICHTCPILDACKQDRLDKIRNDPDFGHFEGVQAGHIHNPRADRRAREHANRLNNIAKANANRPSRPAATQCKRGHQFDDDNTYVDPKGARICRACVRAKRAEWRLRKKGEADAA